MSIICPISRAPRPCPKRGYDSPDIFKTKNLIWPSYLKNVHIENKDVWTQISTTIEYIILYPLFSILIASWWEMRFTSVFTNEKYPSLLRKTDVHYLQSISIKNQPTVDTISNDPFIVSHYLFRLPMAYETIFIRKY